jgi:hypothetical protein
MEVYVDKKPKDCLDCPCFSENCVCNLLNQRPEIRQEPKSCPLILITDYTKQVRNDLLKEIDYMALKKQRNRPNDLYYCDALWEIFIEKLNDIEGETNE